MGDFNIEITARDGAVVVALEGLADLAGVDGLDRQLTTLSARKPPRVIFDLSRLAGISSICMGSLTRFKNGANQWKGSVVLAGAQGIVLTALNRARLDAFFQMTETIEQAFLPGETTGERNSA